MKTFKQFMTIIEETETQHADGFYVTNHKGKLTHKVPFKTESSALAHGQNLIDKHDTQHPVYKVKDGKVKEHMEMEGGYYARVKKFGAKNHHEGKKFEQHKLKPVWDNE